MPPESRFDEQVEFADNPESRCPCVLLLDTSGSMHGERIEALNNGLRAFRSDVLRDSLASRRVDVAVVTFNSAVRVVQPFITIDRFKPPTLLAAGKTSMGAGIEQALTLVEERKRIYRHNGISYYRPWIFMITDGKPEGEPESTIRRAARELRAADADKRITFFAVAVEGADVDRLKQLVPGEPYELERLQFAELFLWLSRSMQSVSQSNDGDVVELPPMGWLKRLAQFAERYEDTLVHGATVIRLITKVTLGIGI